MMPIKLPLRFAIDDDLGNILKSSSNFLSDDQKEILKQSLKKYDPQKVDGFIHWVNKLFFHFEGMVRGSKKGLGHTDWVLEQKSMVGHLKKASEDLVKVSLRFLFKEENYVWDIFFARGVIDKLILLLEKNLMMNKRKKGQRKTAELDPYGIDRLLAEKFLRSFEKPTSYDGGPFMTVVRIVHENLGLPFIDPSKSVRKILKTL
jgi:hypothetical protein